jgi:hypothetical protein
MRTHRMTPVVININPTIVALNATRVTFVLIALVSAKNLRAIAQNTPVIHITHAS